MKTLSIISAVCLFVFYGSNSSSHLTQDRLSQQRIKEGLYASSYYTKILNLNDDGTFEFEIKRSRPMEVWGSKEDCVFGTWKVATNENKLVLYRDPDWFQIKKEWKDSSQNRKAINIYFITEEGDSVEMRYLVNEGDIGYQSRFLKSSKIDPYPTVFYDYRIDDMPYYFVLDSGKLTPRLTVSGSMEDIFIDSIRIVKPFLWNIDPIVNPQTVYPQCGECNNFEVIVKYDPHFMPVVRNPSPALQFDSLVVSFSENSIDLNPLFDDTLWFRH